MVDALDVFDDFVVVAAVVLGVAVVVVGCVVVVVVFSTVIGGRVAGLVATTVVVGAGVSDDGGGVTGGGTTTFVVVAGRTVSGLVSPPKSSHSTRPTSSTAPMATEAPTFWPVVKFEFCGPGAGLARVAPELITVLGALAGACLVTPAPATPIGVAGVLYRTVGPSWSCDGSITVGPGGSTRVAPVSIGAPVVTGGGGRRPARTAATASANSPPLA